jgi:hypothetical protein
LAVGLGLLATHLVSKKVYEAAARSQEGPLRQQFCPAPGSVV